MQKEGSMNFKNKNSLKFFSLFLVFTALQATQARADIWKKVGKAIEKGAQTIVPPVVAPIVVPVKILTNPKENLRKPLETLAPMVIPPVVADPITKQMIDQVIPENPYIKVISPLENIISALMPEPKAPSVDEGPEAPAISPETLVAYPDKGVVFDAKSGNVVLDGVYVLQKDATIFADKVTLNGQIVTLGHKLTIICRQLVFGARLALPNVNLDQEKLRTEFQGEWSHIAAISGLRKAATKEASVSPGKVTLIAGVIRGRPIIHQSKTIYLDQEAAHDAVAGVEIHFGYTETKAEEGVFEKIVVGAREDLRGQLSIHHDLKELVDQFNALYRGAGELVRLMGTYKYVINNPDSALAKFFNNNAEMKKNYEIATQKSLTEQSQKLRDVILAKDAETQEYARKVNEVHAAEIYDLFVPDQIEMATLREQLDQDDLYAPTYLKLDSPKKWNLDFAATFLNQYSVSL